MALVSTTYLCSGWAKAITDSSWTHEGAGLHWIFIFNNRHWDGLGPQAIVYYDFNPHDLKEWPGVLEIGFLPWHAIWQVHGFGKATDPLWATISSPDKWGSDYLPTTRDTFNNIE